MRRQLQLDIYHILMSFARRIPDEPSKERVDEAFDALRGFQSFDNCTEQLPLDIRATDFTQIKQYDSTV